MTPFQFWILDFRVWIGASEDRKPKAEGATAPPRSKIHPRVGALILSLVLLPSVGRTQQGSVNLDSNEQLFCVLAAINAAGYDAGLGTGTGDNTREEVRGVLSRRPAPAVNAP